MSTFRFEPLTPARWPDFRALFGDHGAFGGCWCMWWRQTRKEFADCHGEENERRMKGIVANGSVPGLLAYDGDEPVAWMSLGPRAEFPSLNRSRTLKPVDDRLAWAIVCFYIDPRHRGRGLMSGLIEAACSHAAERGAGVLEAFPIDPQRTPSSLPASFSRAYMGLLPAFQAAGFVEVARRTDRQPIVRRELG